MGTKFDAYMAVIEDTADEAWRRLFRVLITETLPVQEKIYGTKIAQESETRKS